MNKPWHLYITNGATKTERLEFEDRIHYCIHYNQVEDIRMAICGHTFCMVSLNVQITFDEFMYVLTRMRGEPIRKPYIETPFPVYAALWNDTPIISIGKHGFMGNACQDRECLIAAWEDYWDNA